MQTSGEGLAGCKTLELSSLPVSGVLPSYDLDCCRRRVLRHPLNHGERHRAEDTQDRDSMTGQEHHTT
ncbi:hypothetical protein E2C01_002908 [Portunus trituberculatus]|uniref:Uncharacterized protein n=1 Tax=Portunus trituberculatus TaxID=210409 RepID=A0A5B7CPF6_PORTR|nr:hypothetical protein [Portunus trituberculatus]